MGVHPPFGMRRPGRLITGVVVSVPSVGDTPPLAGEGWRLELADGWVVRPAERAGDWVVTRAP
jgi:hypothetical protein